MHPLYTLAHIHIHIHTHTYSSVKKITMKTAVLLFASALQLQLVVSNLTHNKTKLNDVMCDATHACLDGEHCCFNTDGTPAGCCDNGFVCDVAAGTCDLKGENGTVMKSNGESMRMKSTNGTKKATVKSADPSPYCKKDHKFGVNPCSGTWTDYWLTHTAL
jgi:hypothetical protein